MDEPYLSSTRRAGAAHKPVGEWVTAARPSLSGLWWWYELRHPSSGEAEGVRALREAAEAEKSSAPPSSRRGGGDAMDWLVDLQWAYLPGAPVIRWPVALLTAALTRGWSDRCLVLAAAAGLSVEEGQVLHEDPSRVEAVRALAALRGSSVY